MKKRPTPFEKPSALEPRSNHNTDDLFSGIRTRVWKASGTAKAPDVET